MSNKVFLLVCLTLANLISCKEKQKLEYSKWEHLNIQIISSYADSICLKKADKILPVDNYIEIFGYGISTEEKFNKYVEMFQKKENAGIKAFSKIIDSLFTEENITFFKPQYLAEKDYVNLINETDCIKNRKKEYPNEKVELASMRKVKGFGKVLFTKDYKYGILNFFDSNGPGYIVFKKNNGIYERYLISYFSLVHTI
nr:hypothetical protein [uncultured Lacinutrix sp.]